MSLYMFVALALLVVGGAASTAFVLIYGWVAPWWRSQEGWNLFGFTGTIALLIDLSLVQHFAGPLPGLRAIALAIYAAIAVFMCQRLWLLIRAQRRGRANDKH